MRADRLGAGIAPTLDRLAASSVQFTAARTAVPLTLPSHATILTGLLPPAHGVRENGVDVLSDTHQTIATQLKRAGYRTAAFVGAFVLDRRFGLAQGFETYDDQIPRDPSATDRLEAERPAQAVIDRALAWLEQQARSTRNGPPNTAHAAPFFLWVHLYDPHAPYNPTYDAEIAAVDTQIARLLERLRVMGADRTLLVVAGDHGEGLDDHGERTHGMLLYDSTLRVPLIVSAPGVAAAKRTEAVSLADVAPTILEAVGVTRPPAMKGRDLIAKVRLEADPTRDLYAETEYPRVAGWSPLQALTDGRWMAIRAGTATELYDLPHDAQQRHDVSGTQGATAAALAARIDAIHASASSSTTRTVSPEAQERLRALGYVASSAPRPSSSGAPNPAAGIASWNAFEEALASLNDRNPRAIDALKRLANAHRDALVFTSTYARAVKDAGAPAEALAIYREAARRWPTDATLLHDLAVAAREAAARAPAGASLTLRQEAERAEAAALVLSPTHALAQNGLGLLAVDQNRPRDAATAFERATALDPTNASYWTNLGNARRALGDRAGAEQAYRRALEIDGRAADAANGLGVLLVEARRPADAIVWLERAVAAAPDFVEGRLNLGIALQEAGQPARAAEAYRAVLAAPVRFARERDAAAKLLASLGGGR